MNDSRKKQALHPAVIVAVAIVMLVITIWVVWYGLAAGEPAVSAGTTPGEAKTDSRHKGFPANGLAEPAAPNTGVAARDRVLHYSFEQKTISVGDRIVTIADLSGKDNAGIAKNVGVVEKGAIGSAGGFNGINSCIVAGNGPALRFAGQFTLAAFVKLGGGQVTGPIIAKNDWQEGPRGFALRIEGNRASFNIAADTWHEILLPDELPANEWVHLAGTFDGRTMRLYVNGVEAGRKNVPTKFQQSVYPLMVGMCSFDAARKCAAEIDEVMVFSSALADEEIRGLGARR